MAEQENSKDLISVLWSRWYCVWISDRGKNA